MPFFKKGKKRRPLCHSEERPVLFCYLNIRHKDKKITLACKRTISNALHMRPRPRHLQAAFLILLAATSATAGLSNKLPRPAPPGLLLWLPVHASEPNDHVQAVADCLFQRWPWPSLRGRGFDIVVTLAGDEKDVGADGLSERAAWMQSIIRASTRHLSPPPRVAALPITLAADAYDVDEARGRRSSFAGPNELFYRAMANAGEGAGSEGVGNATTHSSAASTSLATLIAQYAFVQVIETDCCATADGWLEALLQPMLANPALLISGSRGRGACWTGAEYGGCTPLVDAATPHAHLRDHINGNAMYRVGPDLRRLATFARDRYGSTVPFDVALHLVGGGGGGTGRAADNGRAYSVMGGPVDEARFTEAAYYGSEPPIAFVHAPRRLRAPAQRAILRRLDTRQPVTVVVVGAEVDHAFLAHVHAGLVRARETRNAIFLVLDEDAYANASRLAPMRVLMTGSTASAREPGSPAQVTASILHSLAALARADLATFTISVHDSVLQPYTKQLVALRVGKAGTVWLADDGGGTVGAKMGAKAPASTSSSRPQPPPLFLPPGEQAATLLEAWAEEEAKATPLSIQGLAAHHHLALASLPPDLFPPASSWAGPLWTDAARRRVAAVVAWDGHQPSPATPAALSAVGLWRSPSPPGLRCANFSMLGHRPLPLTTPATIHRSLAARAAFAGFVRDRAIACAVLPGFRLATTGNVVPDEAVLVREGGGLLAEGTVVFTSVADLEAAGRAGGGVIGEFVPFMDGARAMTPPARSKPASAALAACAVLGPPVGTVSCFTARIASLIDAAIAALPPSYTCAVDACRTHQDVVLVSLEGRLGEVSRLVRSGRGRAPILLTGAWRHVGGGQIASTQSASPNIATLADLAVPPSTPLDPMSRLVRFGATIASATSLAASPWADVIEYAVCQAADDVFDLAEAAAGILPLLLTPASTLARRAALIPPAVLGEDLAALARWLDRPDRPSLASGRRARLDLAGSSVVVPEDFQDAILAPALGLALAVGAEAVMLPSLPVPWSAIIGEPALRRAYTDHAALLPGSVAGLLGLSTVVGDNDTMKACPHPASVDVLHSPAHRGAVRALEHALGLGLGGRLATPPILYIPATLPPSQHARLQHFAAGAQDVVFSF